MTGGKVGARLGLGSMVSMGKVGVLVGKSVETAIVGSVFVVAGVRTQAIDMQRRINISSLAKIPTT